MRTHGDDNTKGGKRADKQFRDKHKMKVVGRSALLWERIKQEKAQKAKQENERKEKENDREDKKNKSDRHRRSDSFWKNRSFFNFGQEV